ncbi:hypothetical protein Y032_0406g892 [Ancylostoma ceylanicum]|uniref:Uncharacterized protein n=1 Tax=Ancylostoma ceylanicum TaxID=53326 RepID=A0A016X3N1_9BILA|nr:hypothetical protein Y032_0406g892 [Ancylostoma ceylanicum]
MLMLPLREPEDRYCWVQFAAVVDLWLTCGAHVLVVNGPRSNEVNSWDRMNEKARQHLRSYFDTHPDLLLQLRDLVPTEPGVTKSGMACSRIGVVEDPRRWWQWAQVTEFYRYLRSQLSSLVTQEEVRVPKSV